MNALAKADAANAPRREDVLRELNLYPLWQLRVTVAGVAPQVLQDALPEVMLPHAPPATKEDQPAVLASLPADLGWAELKEKVKACNACKLRAGCIQTVFGSGDENADWLFVGSWPTEDDEASGAPFAGRAGQLLDNMLATIQLKRGDNVYLANVVKCSGSIKSGPGAEEIAQCSPYLARQIMLLQPKVIVALGHAAASALLGMDREWSSLLGKVHEFSGLEKEKSQVAIPLVITHHPAALLLTPQNKAQTWQDLCLARDTMLSL